MQLTASTLVYGDARIEADLADAAYAAVLSHPPLSVRRVTLDHLLVRVTG
ncbi:MAG TPA: hypothetical protein VF299_03895 [Mycobacterium sp.]